MLLLLSCCFIIAGVTAEDPPMVYYRLKNSSVCLHVRTTTSSHRRSDWDVNGKIIVLEDEINPNYTNKVDYYLGNHSLCIKELTDTDSGIYKFSFVDKFDKRHETHSVIVQEMVPTPVIVTSVLSSNLSAGTCNISVNCSIHNAWLWSFCDEDSCRTSQRSLSRVNITISTDNRTVVCSANNHVSINNVSESTTAACFNKSNHEHKEASQQLTLIIIAFTVCASLFAFMIFVAKRLSSTKADQTSTAHLIQNQQVEAQTQPEPRGSTSSVSQAEAAYENVSVIHPSQTSSTRHGLGSTPSQTVDTVYSVLEAPKVSNRSKDTKGHRKTGDAPTSQSVTPGEAEHCVQIDTVYSMLQKPKKKSEVTAPQIGQ